MRARSSSGLTSAAIRAEHGRLIPRFKTDMARLPAPKGHFLQILEAVPIPFRTAFP